MSPALPQPAPAAVRRAAYVTLFVALVHIIFGAIVRITGSGMGCGDHWPKCYGRWFPPLDRPDLARLITDDDPETFWQSNPASVQLGGEPGTTKPGIGLLMTLPEGTALSQVQLRGLTLRVGSAVSGSSGHGWRGYRARSSARACG